ncbi:MAG: hypothetical protein Kow0042_18940 [Calditrichia bacterium]
MKTILCFWGAILVLFLQATPQATAQNNWQNFRNRVEGYYYNIEQTGVENFSCLFTTGGYLDYVYTNFDSSYNYPLKMIWTRQGKVWYILQPYPPLLDEKVKKEMLAQIQLVRKTFKGFFLDWQSFLLTSPFSDIPDDAEVTVGRDSIQIKYTSGEGDLTAVVKKLFLPSGKLIQVTVESLGAVVVNYPIYTEVENKWVCIGWNSQIYKEGNISSGIACRMELQKISGYWMPIRADMLVQISQKPEEKYLNTIYLKDYIFNIPLQEIQQRETPGKEP